LPLHFPLLALLGAGVITMFNVTRSAFVKVLAVCFFLCLPVFTFAATFFVSTTGSDTTGTGSLANPWATLSHAATSIPDDGSTVLVMDGTYNGRVRLNRRFVNHTIFRSQNPYKARLVNSSSSDQIVTSFGGANFTVQGFEITRPSPSATGALIMQIQQEGTDGSIPAEDIIIRDNIFHDSYNNDILKINNVCDDILVEGNVFYNQSGSDEHIDVNGVTDVVIQDNLFFNDFAGSGRTNNNDTSSYIVIKNSAALPLNERITVRRNVFLNWEGSTGNTFVLCGEDGQNFYEVEDVMVENNLMIGNSPNTMRTAFGVKGARDITFRNNTVVGNLPALAYAMRLNLEGSNPQNQNIFFYNNIWSDPTGTMEDFSDGMPSETSNAVLDSNLYFNGSAAFPSDLDVLQISDDANAVTANPLLGSQSSVVLPRWNSGAGQFVSGNTTIRDEFVRLVSLYGTIATGSGAIDLADPAQAPAEDIFGNARDSQPDLGAFEFGGSVAIIVNPASLPSGSANVAYSQNITASGGSSPYSFAVTSGSLPGGLTLTSGGLLSGTPASAGNFNFTITATDSSNNTGNRNFSLSISSCMFCDDFEDGVLAPNWTYSKPSWSETGGNLVGNGTSGKTNALAIPVFLGCSSCSFRAVVQTAGGTKNRLWVFAWHTNNKNRLELQIKEASDVMILKQKSNGTVVSKLKVNRQLLPNTNYDIRMARSGSSVQLFVDNQLAGTLSLTGNPTGTVGFQVASTTGRFALVEVN